MAVTKTLDDIINRQDRYDLNKITFYTATDDQSLVIQDTDLYTIYLRFIAPYIGSYKVTPAQRSYYRYKPYLLSADVYGTPELGWMILAMNDRECAPQITLKQYVKLIPTTYLEELYDTVITNSTDKLSRTWTTYLPMVTTNA